jgi:UDP-N-acetylmuramoyl-tripeptide--D-alanyl-D-alanine ligase
MLQQFEYDPFKLVKWILSIPDLKNVVNRGKLVITAKSAVLLGVGYLVFLCAYMAGFYLIVIGQYVPAIALFIFSFDFAWMTLFIISLVGKKLVDIKRRPLMKEAMARFDRFEGQKIAILGSYGKTSMKEILNTVLQEKYKVACTPGNKNVPISHARWIKRDVSLEEDFLIIEYGEGEPGDISKLASLSNPNIAIMTGLAPNHLDHYKTLDKLINDFLDIEKYVSGENLYVNSGSKEYTSRLKNKAVLYSDNEVNGWKVSEIKLFVNKTTFTMKRGPVELKLSSGLIGRHNVGPLSLAAAFAYKNGMSKQEVESAISKTKPFKHRMEPRNINGAWIIDDTYNGNLEGFKSGIKFLKEIPANRKIYVTPGLVDQGEENERVHKEIAEYLSNSDVDQLVLMSNPNTKIIESELASVGFKGQIKIEDKPLSYYQNIDQFIAAGDVVLMQNDLPDAYS